MRRLYFIELFAGTHSVSNAVKRSAIAREHDVRVLLVDIGPKFQPSVVANIVTWLYGDAIAEFLSTAIWGASVRSGQATSPAGVLSALSRSPTPLAARPKSVLA